MSTPMLGQGESRSGIADAPAWRAGTIFAIALHAGLAAAIVCSQFGVEDDIEPFSSAITLDLAPIASAPPQPVTNLPEGPPVEEPEPVEEEAEPVPEPPLPQPAEVALPEPVARPQPQREAAAPAASPLPPAQTTTAPVNAAPSSAEVTSMPSYRALVFAHLKRHQQYPRAAKRRQLESTVTVTFRVDRQGNVLSQSIVEGSGYEILDREALATIGRANPMPPVPPEISTDTVSLTVPIRFELSE
ncbi:energy transducer TonB [Parvibaculum sp.]|uniref:energy transducer TonB n=1 Tax=Parvibaculum sp. TaxID=2024848 RepID=UPI00391C0244